MHVQTNTTKKTVCFKQFRPITDISAGRPASNAASKQQLGTSIGGMHVTQSVNRIEPILTLHMGNPVRVANDFDLTVGSGNSQGFHQSCA
jgi:hypothetical protein